MYASACLLLLLSLRCLVSHNPYSTQTRTLCTTATAQYSYLTVIPLSYFLAQPCTMHKPQKLFPSLLLLLCGDISLNPGPVSAPNSYPAAFVTPSAAAAVLGQNGTDKMVWTKWYTDKMVLDKMV